MSAITFGKLLMINFGPFAEAAIDLANRGLLFVRGENSDTTSADSNGSGKTHVMKAITWALHGETSDGDKPDKIIRYGEKHVDVALQWFDGDGEWVVTRGKQRGSAMTLKLEHDNQDVSAPTLAGTQAEIIRRLGMDFATWRNTVLYAQGDVVRFADPATTDSERKLILKRILRLDVMDKALDLARGQVREIDRHIANNQHDLRLYEGELAGLGDSAELDTALKTALADIKELEKKSKRLPKLRELFNEVKAEIDEIVRQRNEDQAAEDQNKLDQQALYTAAVAAASKHRGNIIAAERDARRIDSDIAQFDDGKCPTCGSKSASPAVKAKVAALVADRRAAEQRSADATAEADAADKNAAEAKAAQLAITQRVQAIAAAAQAEISKWSPKLAEVQREITLAEQALVDTNKAKARADWARQQLAKVEDRRQSINAFIDDINGVIKSYEEDKVHLEFWMKGFGNAGLPSFLMDNVVPELTMRANHYLDILADGDIVIGFDTQSKLKSGESREKFAINWSIEGVPEATPSGGQRKKISIAVDLALMDLVAAREKASIDLLLMDEVLDGLDATGRARIMSLLAELRQKRSTILVISHDSAISELFEHSVIIKKHNNVAVLEEES